jgi:hypothetical protein
MRRLTAILVLGLGALLPTAGAPGGLKATNAVLALDTQYQITGTLGANGWYVSNVTVKWTVTGETRTEGCDTQTLSVDTPGQTITCHAWNDDTKEEVLKSVTIKLDKTAPGLVPDPVPDPNAAGWHKAALTVKFPGSDLTSGIASCTADQNYGGPDTSGIDISGSCTDKAGNSSGLKSYTVKYDATAPGLVPQPSRGSDVNGWYNHALTISFPGIDGTSGLANCSPDQPYSAPDSSNATVQGSCTDKAGNTTAKTFGFQYDATAPALVPDPVPDPNANGWHKAALTVKFPGSDGTSGIATCTADQDYSGPDTTGTVITGTCTDKAGNSSGSKSYIVKYDTVAPTLVPDPVPDPNANGWHKAALTVKFPGSDGTSGIASCTADQDYSGPDTTGTQITGFCTDKAGNSSGPKSYTVKYDTKNPTVDGISPPPKATGWYTAPVTFSFVGSDGTSGSGLDACPDVTYDGPDSADAAVIGVCSDKAGNVGTKPFPLKYDDTGPAVTASAARAPDTNGWYNHSLSVSFAGSDAASGLASCASPQTYDGPDGVLAVVTGTCIDHAGNVGLGSLALKYDSTAPEVVGASPDRAADGNGWYNHALEVRFQGSDATSQVDACTVVSYLGPDNPSASVSGFCRDRAGNPSGPGAFPFKYDSSAPSVTKLTVKAGNRSATLSWEVSSDTNQVEIFRTAGMRAAGVTVYRGNGRTFKDTRLENGVRYRYTLTGYDDAENTATTTAAAIPTAPLVSPAAGARVTAPPRLRWVPVVKATYYNVQVWRKGKIFSSWPKGTSIKLKRTWIYDGRRYRLTPGKYRWYVWPGLGARTGKKFGPLLGSSSFVVRAR